MQPPIKRNPIRIVSTSLLLLLLLPLTTALPALGEERPTPFLEGRRLLQPFSRLLSGPIGLLVEDDAPLALRLALSEQPRDLILQAPAAGLIPFREPTAKFSRNIIVTQDLGRFPFQDEPSIAFNPKNPDNVVIGTIDFQFFTMVAYTSFDGGLSWEGPIMMKPLQLDDFTADPIVGFDREGNAYFAYMSIGTKPVRAAGTVLLADVANIVLARSEDGGLTWSEPTLAARGLLESFINQTSGVETVRLTFLDKPWMTIGPDPEDPSKDRIYITYTKFDLLFPIFPQFPFVGIPTVRLSIELVSSEDGGLTWSEPRAVSPVLEYLFGDLDRRIVQGSMPVVASDGTLYVGYYDSLDDGPWQGAFSVMVVRSEDGGLTWSEPVPVAEMPELDFTIKPSIFRAWSSMFAYLAVGPEGNLYAVFAADPPGPDRSDIYLVVSKDGGKTWSEPKRVNDDLTSNNQFFPFVDVDSQGVVHIMWGDMRDDPSNNRYHIYYTRSTDQGASFDPNSRVSDSPSNPLQSGIPTFIGDYFGLAAAPHDVYLAWTDSRVGVVGGFNQDIAFARLRPAQGPRLFISPPAGPAGQEVTIQGFNFAPNFRNVFIEIDGVLVSSVVTNREGRFTTKLFIPAVSEGPHVIRAFDVTGNVAEASFFAELGINTIGEDLKKAVELIDRGVGELGSKTEELGSILAAGLGDLRDARPDLGDLGRRIGELRGELRSLQTELEVRTSSLGELITFTALIAGLAFAASMASLLGLLLRRR